MSKIFVAFSDKIQISIKVIDVVQDVTQEIGVCIGNRVWGGLLYLLGTSWLVPGLVRLESLTKWFENLLSFLLNKKLFHLHEIFVF